MTLNTNLDIKPLLIVRIISPKGVLFASKAYSVSSKNTSGNFDILPYHANMITFVEKSPIIIHKFDNEKETFNFIFAIISNVDNHVNIYTELQHPLEITNK